MGLTLSWAWSGSLAGSSKVWVLSDWGWTGSMARLGIYRVGKVRYSSRYPRTYKKVDQWTSGPVDFRGPSTKRAGLLALPLALHAALWESLERWNALVRCAFRAKVCRTSSKLLV